MTITEMLKNRLLSALRTPEARDEMTAVLEAVPTEAPVDAEYVPAVPTDWSPAPTTIQEAMDQLAARVKALETP